MAPNSILGYFVFHPCFTGKESYQEKKTGQAAYTV